MGWWSRLWRRSPESPMAMESTSRARPVDSKLRDALAELRRLNKPVPRPLRLPTVDEVDAAERILGIKFHPDFRTYLLQASDVIYGCLEPVQIVLPKANTSLFVVATSAWNDWGVPRDLLSICDDNADQYCIDSVGRIVFRSHDGGAEKTWPDLATWIRDVWIKESAELDDGDDDDV